MSLPQIVILEKKIKPCRGNKNMQSNMEVFCSLTETVGIDFSSYPTYIKGCFTMYMEVY